MLFKSNGLHKEKIKNSSILISSLLVLTSFIYTLPVQAETSLTTQDIKNVKKISDVINLAKGEYRESSVNGKIVKQEEYHEANLFLEQAEDELKTLEKNIKASNKTNFDNVKQQLDILISKIKAKVTPEEMASQVKVADQSLENFAGMSLKEFPNNTPSLDNGRKIFQQNCTTCHGVKGFGDGAASKSLNTAPANFHDLEFMNKSTPYGFYRAIKNGITGTAMPSWEYQLSQQEKWDVLTYVESLHKDDNYINTGKNLYNSFSSNININKISNPLFSVDKSNNELISILSSDKELSNKNEKALMSLVEYVRENKTDYKSVVSTPEVSKEENIKSTIKEIKNLLYLSKEDYLKGENNKAINDSIASYLSFEPVEKELGAKDTTLARKLELDFSTIKGLYAKPGNEKEIDKLIVQIEEGLEKASSTLVTTKEGTALFLESMFLIMREGFEAIIIIAALLSFVRKASPDSKLIKNMYTGIGLGVLASFITAFILETALSSAKFSKEFLEGATVLFAAGILFYVSHWMISKTQSQQWQKFIRSTLSSALSNKNQMAIVSVGFLSVYREGFETILFYKALYTTSAATDMITFGLMAGCVGLAIISTLLYKFSVKIPIKEFFFATGILLYYMVFSFVGKGLREFQEGNILSITSIPGVPQIDLIGLYPTLETVSAQLIVLLLWVGAVVYSFNAKDKEIVKKEKVANSAS